MNSPVTASIPILPLLVLAGALNVRESPSGSLALTFPVTTPVMASGTPTVGTPAVGAELVGVVANGLITTATDTSVNPPLPSVTVTTKLSALSAGVASALAAFCRAATVGV